MRRPRFTKYENKVGDIILGVQISTAVYSDFTTHDDTKVTCIVRIAVSEDLAGWPILRYRKKMKEKVSPI